MAEVLLCFRDLKDRGIINNHVTLKRWIEREGFPPGLLLGPNSRAWRASDVEAWLDSRPTCVAEPRGAAKQNRGGRS
jgi:hypothetical protein